MTRANILFIYVYMNNIEIIGYVAMCLSIMSFFPIVFTVYKTKKTNNFPYQSIFLALSAHTCWLIYGLYSNTSATEYSGFIFVLMYLFMLYIKMNY